MSIRIIGKSKEVNIPLKIWVYALEQASNNGWEPLGTQHSTLVTESPEKGEYDPPWLAGYFPSNYQLVVGEDALYLAEALEIWLSQEDETKSPGRIFIDTGKSIIELCEDGGDILITSS